MKWINAILNAFAGDTKMNRKKRKKRKMHLKRLGLEVYTPHYLDIITTSPIQFPFKIAKHFNGYDIQAGKLRGYEFTRPISKKL